MVNTFDVSRFIEAYFATSAARAGRKPPWISSLRRRMIHFWCMVGVGALLFLPAGYAAGAKPSKPESCEWLRKRMFEQQAKVKVTRAEPPFPDHTGRMDPCLVVITDNATGNEAGLEIVRILKPDFEAHRARDKQIKEVQIGDEAFLAVDLINEQVGYVRRGSDAASVTIVSTTGDWKTKRQRSIIAAALRVIAPNVT